MLTEKVGVNHFGVVVDLVLKAAQDKKNIHYRKLRTYVVAHYSKVEERNLINKDISTKYNIVIYSPLCFFPRIFECEKTISRYS